MSEFKSVAFRLSQQHLDIIEHVKKLTGIRSTSDAIRYILSSFVPPAAESGETVAQMIANGAADDARKAG